MTVVLEPLQFALPECLCVKFLDVFGRLHLVRVVSGEQDR